MRDTIFEKKLRIWGSCAQDTLIAVMLDQQTANDEYEARRQIATEPGIDLLGIQNSVITGLNKAAELLNVDSSQLVSEENLGVLKNLTAAQIFEILEAIIEDDSRSVQWAEVVKNLLFVQKYLIAGGAEVNVEEIKVVFDERVAHN